MVRTKTTPRREDLPTLTPRDESPQAPPAYSSARRVTRSSNANLTPGLDREPRRKRNTAADDDEGVPSDPSGKGKKVADQDPDDPKGKKKATGKGKKSDDVDSSGKKSDDSKGKVTKRGKGVAAAKCKRSDLDDGGDDVDGDGSSGLASKKGKREAAGKSKKSDGGDADVASKKGNGEKSVKDDGGDDVDVGSGSKKSDDLKGKGKKAAVALRPVTRMSSILKVVGKSGDGDDQKADDDGDDDDDDDGGKGIVARLPRRFDKVILQTWMGDILFRRKSNELKDVLESNFPDMTVVRNIEEVKQGQFDILDGDHEPFFSIHVEDPPYPKLQEFDIDVVVNIIKDAQK